MQLLGSIRSERTTADALTGALRALDITKKIKSESMTALVEAKDSLSDALIWYSVKGLEYETGNCFGTMRTEN